MSSTSLPSKVGNKSFPSLVGALMQVKPEKKTSPKSRDKGTTNQDTLPKMSK